VKGKGLFERSRAINEFSAIKISLASPEKIRSWSCGEVTKPETINYRTFKPERDGLFCAKIFGPVTDWECLCGKYKRMKHRGVICDKCGVEVTQSKVRRERMGHIELASPVSHVWFLKGLPSRIGYALDIALKDLESVLYFESYIVVDPGDTLLQEKQLLSEEEFRTAQDDHGNAFVAKMGAEAIKELLSRLDVDDIAADLREQMKTETSSARRLKASKRLKVIDAFRRSGNRPEWMILDVIPVIPPELRPLVPLDGGRFATSDLNDLYRRVINRNNRLKKLLELRAPEVIIRNEKRMLQEAVDALFDNGRRGRVLRGSNNRPLKSLSDTLKGKQGRFRQNLLGKRVDYSGRSVIVVGPELKLHQCGLPKKMALELFKPFIYNKLEQRGYVATIKAAKEMVEAQRGEVWDILEEVIKEHPVLLNRAPTLHRLGIQGFEPVLVEGKAIKIHPFVCHAFNADFDGDQMAVHVPLSSRAIAEARVLMLSSRNILSPANGKPIVVPTQDIVLGAYYLTKERPGTAGAGRVFASPEEVVVAHESGEVATHAPIRLRYSGELIDLTTVHDDQDLLHTEAQVVNRQLIRTTVGRVLFNEFLGDDMPFVNGLLKKKGLGQLIQYAYLRYGNEHCVRLIDQVKEAGFTWATYGGVSISISDMEVPAEKERFVEDARREVVDVEKQYESGAITRSERYNKVVHIWSGVTEKVAKRMFDSMAQRDKQGVLNPIFIMADSGARGSKEQIRQLAGMRGLMAKPSGEIIETPITSNFREGLSVLQYFISTHGARKGLADTALKTADSGYLTRRLVDVAQDVIVTERDCGTFDGIEVGAIVEGGETIEALRDRVVGRVTLEDVHDMDGGVIAGANTEIDAELANGIQQAGIDLVKIRSVLTCESRRGVCARCYGWDLATGRLVELGQAVGVIAAQSIGEPGTQLTMRTFHIGGAAATRAEESRLEARNAGWVQLRDIQTVADAAGNAIVTNRNGYVIVRDPKNRELERHPVVYGAKLHVKEGQEIRPGTLLVEWDPFMRAILTEHSGAVDLQDLVEGTTVREEVDEITGFSRKVVTQPIGTKDEKLQPAARILDASGQSRKVIKKYLLPAGAQLMVENGQAVHAGDILAKLPRATTKQRDITGGLPRVVELFEARKPKEPAIITEIEGAVEYGKVVKGLRKVTVTNAEAGEAREYSIPKGMHLQVQDGEKVQAGEALVDGPINPHDILAVRGRGELQDYLLDEIQEVYRLQGVDINDKHIEVIVRQMMRWVKVKEVGDTPFHVGEQVDRFRFQEVNDQVVKGGGQPASAEELLLGITKASLATDSFISAASFQETTRVLTEAALNGRIDYLRGLKENVIMGRLVPAGTGFHVYREVVLEADPTIEPEVDPLAAAETAGLPSLLGGEIEGGGGKRDVANI
jgi:DNA-directed RNA polymerase subunit beta'